MTEILASCRQAREDLAALLLEKEMIEPPQLQAILNKQSFDDAA